MSTAEPSAVGKPARLSTPVAVDIVKMNKWYGDFHVLRDINLRVMAANASSSAGRPAPASRR